MASSLDALPDVPGYRLLEELGRGAMGVVYKARDLRLGRLVALKLLLARGRIEPALLERFRREGEAIARVRHPNVLRIYGTGEFQGLPFLVMEYAEGGTLAQELSDKTLSPRAAAHLLRTIARGVHVAHLQGIVHRDLKPGNVLMTRDGEPKVSDFGLAKLLQDLPSAAATADDPTGPLVPSLTGSGMIVGTPRYLAPEQAAAENQRVCPATDVYALGVMLYEFLTRRPVFPGPGLAALLAQIRTSDPPLVRSLNPSVPRALEAICHKCLQKDPGARYPQAGALADELDRFLGGAQVDVKPIRTDQRVRRWTVQHRARIILAGCLVLILSIGLMAYGLRPRPDQAGATFAAAEVRRQKTESQAHLRALAIAMHNYHNDYLSFPGPAIHGRNGEPLLSWRVTILPYLGHDNLYRKFKLDEPWDSPHNRELLNLMPEDFTVSGRQPADSHSTYYQVCVGAESVFARNPATQGPPKPDSRAGLTLEDVRVHDGLRWTLLIVEAGEPVPWTKPQEVAIASGKPPPQLGGLFADGFHAACADTSVRFFRRSILDDPGTLHSLIGWRDGGLAQVALHEGDPQFERPGEFADEGERYEWDLRAKVQSLADLKEIAQATYAYSQRTSRILPAAITRENARFHFPPLYAPPPALPPSSGNLKDVQPLLSWRVALLPYLQEKPLFDKFKLDEPWDSPHNRELLRYVPRVFANPVVRTSAPHTTHYRRIVGPEAFPETGYVTWQQIHDAGGVSSVLAVVDARDPVLWTKPEELHYAADLPIPGLGGTFRDGFGVAFLSGEAAFLKSGLLQDERQLRQLISWKRKQRIDVDELFDWQAHPQTELDSLLERRRR